jgi:hypothetical protein
MAKPHEPLVRREVLPIPDPQHVGITTLRQPSATTVTTT